MFLEDFVGAYCLDDIIDLEFRDEQFLCLQRAWCAISQFSFFASVFHAEVFLYLVVQNALVSYQIAGNGMLWWQEFAAKIVEDFVIIDGLLRDGKGLVDWWYLFLLQSRYNKRLYNAKCARISAFDSVLYPVFLSHSFGSFYGDMTKLYSIFISVSSSYSKTCCFAVKMYGYACRALFRDIHYYPSSVPIPLDSRLQKIYINLYGEAPFSVMLEYFSTLAMRQGLPPLHLDSLLRLQYWPLYMSR